MDRDLPTPDELPPPHHFALMAAIFEGGLVVVAVGLGWLLDRDPMESFPEKPDEAAWGVGWGIAATLPPLLLLWLGLKCPWRPFVELTRVVDTLLVPLFRHLRLLELAVISVLAGLGEEMLFRGIIQQGTEDWVSGEPGVWVGLAAAAFLFGLMHRITLAYALLAGLIGFYLGGIWLATDNLLVPITAHAVYDFMVLVYLTRIREQISGEEPRSQ